MHRHNGKQIVGYIFITIVILGYGVVPLFADLNSTHVLNPDWTGHARLHAVWLLSIGVLIALLSLYLLWVKKEVSLAVLLSYCILGGFYIASITAFLYGGTLEDPPHATDVAPVTGGNLLLFVVLGVVLLLGHFLSQSKNDYTEK